MSRGGCSILPQLDAYLEVKARRRPPWAGVDGAPGLPQMEVSLTVALVSLQLSGR